MRAVVESHHEDDDLPAIKTIIVKAKEDLTIKVNKFNVIFIGNIINFYRSVTKVAEFHVHHVTCYFNTCIQRHHNHLLLE